MRIFSFFKKGDTQINFMKYYKLSGVISALLVVISISLVAVKGLNFGIDFSGGILMEVKLDTNVSDLRNIFKDQNKEVQIQNIENDIFLIRVPSDDANVVIQKNTFLNQTKLIQTIQDSLAKKFSDIDYRKIDYVGPQIGSELILKGVLALFLSFFAIMFYIWLRFDWQFGLGGIIAIIHDTILVLGFYCVTQIEFNLTSIAALLTVVGYSINDSVVIFDRIRENLIKLKKAKMFNIINSSLNSTLSRTILTAFTTLLSLLALLIFGGSVLQSFSAGAFFGILVGVYSSIYIAAPILIHMDPRKVKDSKAI